MLILGPRVVTSFSWHGRKILSCAVIGQELPIHDLRWWSTLVALRRALSRRRLTRLASAPFEVRASRPYPASYTSTHGRSRRFVVPGFLRPFGCRRSLLEPSCARCGIPPSSRSAYQAHTGLDHIGVVTFHMRQIRPGWVPSGPRGRWCAPARPNPSGRHLPPHSDRSLSPTETSHRRECS